MVAPAFTGSYRGRPGGIQPHPYLRSSMSKHSKPESEPLGNRTQRPHAEDGWKVERDHTEPTGIQQDDRNGWPAGDPNRGRRA